jgi:hypothetical protein
MTATKRVQFALLFGALAEIVLVAPLLVVYPHLGGPFPVWVDVLKKLQIPSAPLVLRVAHWGLVRQLAARFRLAHEISLAAEVLSMLIQAAIFALLALGVVYVWQLRQREQSP